MGVNISKSTSTSVQTADVDISQQFAGTCNMSCSQIMSGVDVKIKDSDVQGGINFTQTCSVDANCIINSSMDAASDVLFKTGLESNAKSGNSGIGLLKGFSLFDYTSATSTARQAIKQSLSQANNQECNVSSDQQITDVSVSVENSTIGGGINFNQSSSVQAKCALSNSMSAAAQAAGFATVKSQSGGGKIENKKASKFSGKSFLFYFGIFAAIIIIIMIVSKMFTSSGLSSKFSSDLDRVSKAKVAAGCPGGYAPITDEFGVPVVDPKTLGPICPVY